MSFPSISHLSGYAILFVLVVISVIAIRVGFRFDISKRLETRKATQEIKLKNMCPHFQTGEVGGKCAIRSLFVSPSGTANWICQQCGMVSYTEPDDLDVYWSNHIPELLEKQKAFKKQAKKMGLIP